ncbi:4-hydroxy-tetrahydrodipicolinate reductase [Halanaerobacter jeridensis]|uniref:4-hydroxy-tetrahydrodipicolinate reductase n=1 Tax=Halanaerobacter jeridensis TaxID=706427 RepID=A0A938XYY5_9FIRM|nr:4-hydroxy-tetrahydrodipicolinate reductase [Halanaerobacter jeridensis]MBM7557865.1 4-hydroxy-tetrahydrodipicolinate reductase [Halanaerobacter jeridensis]
MKNIVVSGALGKMGQEVVKLVDRTDNFKLVGAVDVAKVGEDIKEVLNLEQASAEITNDLGETLEQVEADAVVDFTTPQVVMGNIKTVCEAGVDIVVGTTGITEADLNKVKEFADENNKVIIAPNFAIGAILMMEFSKKAAKFLDDVEIIEQHHDGKLDAPSGTAIKTAELIQENLTPKEDEREEIEKLEGARGAEQDGINIHSVRLPGLVAHQEVLFGGEGQTLKLRHDSINRRSFMPGVALAINKLDEIDGVVYGLDNLIEL